MMTFETTFQNNRRTPVQVRDGATVLTYLLPGATGLVEACSPFAMYARWSEVEFTERGVEFKMRKGWVEPDRGKWTLIATNIDGKAFEERLIGKHALWLPRFIPIYVGLDLDDNAVFFKEFKIARVEEKVKDTNLEGYVYSTFSVKDVWVERSTEEVRELYKLRDELNIPDKPEKVIPDIFTPRPVFGGGGRL